MCKYFMYDPAYIPELSPHTFDFDFASFPSQVSRVIGVAMLLVLLVLPCYFVTCVTLLLLLLL